MSRVLVAGAVALAGLSFLIPGALPADSGWSPVEQVKGWLGMSSQRRPPQTVPAEARHGWGEGYVPNVPVVSQDGETFRFFDDLVKDKRVIISFIYTRCPDICPLTTARMAQVRDRLGDAVGRDVFLYSISVEPEYDTPEVLKEYSEPFDPGEGWQFLTGTPENIKEIRFKLGDRRDALSDHTQEVRLGNGATGQWRRAALLGDMESLMLSINEMDPEWHRQKRTVAYSPLSDTGIAYNEDPGQQTFRRFCAPCHTVGVGDRVGPDLRGVSDRREHDWLKRFILSPKTMRLENDPIAVALAEQYPGVDMPTLGLGPIDADEVIEYIGRESARLTEMEAEHRANHDHSGHDHGDHDHGSHDHGDHDHGSHDHGSHDHGSHDHGSHDHGSHDHGSHDH